MLSAIPEEAVCCFPSQVEHAQRANEVSVNIKHTFIELVLTPKNSQRMRSFTDSELLIACDNACLSELSDASTGTPSDEEESDVVEVQHPADWESPYWGPSEDGFYANTMPDFLILPSPADDMMVDQSSTLAFSTGLGYPWGVRPDDFIWAPSWSTEVFAPCNTSIASNSFATSIASNSYAHSRNDRTTGNAKCDGLTVPKTTVMLRNLPSQYTRMVLIETLEDEGFEGSYDLVYVPMDFGGKCSLGYALVNFMAESDASRCWEAFDGFSNWGDSNEKACQVVWSDPHQGVEALIERYRNSPVMHESVPDEWKPAYFVNGAQVRFPSPTETVKAPKQKSARSNGKKEHR